MGRNKNKPRESVSWFPYRPPNSRANYWELISDSIRKANNCVVKVIILGDFNTDFFNNPSQHLMDILNVHQLFQLTNSAARITESTSSCLDLIMMQSPHIVSRTEDLPATCSDHSFPCAYIRNTVIKKKKNIYFYFYITTVNWTQTNSAVYSLMLTGQTSLKITNRFKRRQLH